MQGFIEDFFLFFCFFWGGGGDFECKNLFVCKEKNYCQSGLFFTGFPQEMEKRLWSQSTRVPIGPSRTEKFCRLQWLKNFH